VGWNSTIVSKIGHSFWKRQDFNTLILIRYGPDFGVVQIFAVAVRQGEVVNEALESGKFRSPIGTGKPGDRQGGINEE